MSVGEDRVGDLDAVTVATLVSSPPFENVFGGRVEVDATSTRAGFDGHFQRSSCDNLSTAGDGETVGVALPVAPAETGEFTSAHPGERCGRAVDGGGHLTATDRFAG